MLLTQGVGKVHCWHFLPNGNEHLPWFHSCHYIATARTSQSRLRDKHVTRHAFVLQQQQHSQPGFLDKAMAYVPSLHSSGHSHPTEEVSTTTHKETADFISTSPSPLHSEAQPSLLDKAKAYIPVLGSSTEFDPATEGRIGQQDSLYRATPTGQAGFVPEQDSHESLLDKAKAYVPAMGAPGTTSAGIDVSVLWAAC